MADTPLLVATTLTASTMLGLIAQKVARANAREGVQKDLLLSEQKRHDECERVLRDYRDKWHERNNETLTVHLKELADQDRVHATELAAIRQLMFDAERRHDGDCDKLREDRDKFKELYMQLHAEVSARKSVFIGSVEAWPTGEEKK